MKKQLLSFLTFAVCLLGFTAEAQTLVAGDIVVIGLGSDTGNAAPNTKTEFSWVPLVNLNAGTQFYFTDAGWNTISNEFMGSGLSDEILLRFTVPAGGILAGVVQIVSENGTDANYTVLPGTKCGSDTDGKLSLPNAGDTITVFRSTATVDANFPGTNFTAIFAVTSNTTDWSSLNVNTATVAAAFKDNYSNLPPGLTNGVNAVAVGLGPGVSDEADNVRFEGDTSGSRAAILARVCTLAQWKRYDAGITSPVAYPADRPDFNGSTPVLGWTTNGVSNFSVAGADITPPAVQSISLVGSPAANATSVTYTVTFSESANNISTDDFQLTNVSGTTSGTVSGVSASSGTSVTVTVSSIAGTGTSRLDLKSNTNITDTTGNGNNTNGYVAGYTSGTARSVDRDSPSLSITSAAFNPTNLNPIAVSFTFSESVSGFDSSDVTVNGGSIGSVSGSGGSYTANITPSGDGTITVDVAAGKATDAAGNSNTAATQLSRVSDRTAPTIVSMNASVSNPTNSNSFTLTVTFSESVSGFVQGDISVSNAGLSGFLGSGSVYTVTVTPSSDGTVTANINSAVASDAAGNGNTAASQFSITVDRSQPSVSISSSIPASVTNSNPIPVTITFSESVSNFVQNDIAVGNGSISGFTVNSGSSYSFNLIPSGNGTVTVNVSAGVANDAAGNNNTAATQFSKNYDNVSPTVSFSSGATNPTNSNSFTLTITFSESVSNFVQNDISVSNAGLSGFSGSGNSYSVTVTPSADGTVTANIANNMANDAAGNGNAAATQFSLVVDRLQPSVSITSSVVPGITNTNPIPVTITFSESVSNFAQGDITPGNGSISGFSGSGTTYSFNLIPSSNGTLTVNIAAGVANDAAGNTNTAATQFSKIFDNTSPTVSISSSTSSPTNTTAIPVSITFSESVTGFDQNDITPGNGSISGFTGSGASYSFTLTPTSPGAVTASIVGGIATDAAGNGNTAATQFSITYDNSQPAVTIGSAASSPTNSNSIPVTFTFNEDVSGFTVGDISVGNGTPSGFTANSATSYSAIITPTAAGTVTVNIAAGSATDSAGNGNAAATQFSIVYDNVQPTVTISSPVSNPTNANSFVVNFNFSESVTNFISGDITVTNGSVSNFNGSGSSYSVTITPALEGTVTVNVAAAVANDTAGNSNTAATQFSIVSDKNGPSVSITSTATSPTNASSIPLTFTFSEPVTGFDTLDITVLSGSISGFAGSGAVYTANLAPSADGTVTLFIFQNNAFDASGNGNSFATFSIISDKTKPTVSISSSESTPTSTNPIPITFNFNEDTTNFTVGDITATGGTLSGFSGSGSTYTVNLIPSGNGSKTVRLLANVMSDAAGNTNNASATFTIFYITPCSQTTTWNGLFWTNGDPVPTQPAVIAADYNSSDVNPEGFSACSLIIGNNANVVINPGGNITITGTINVQSGSTMTFESGSNLIQGGTSNSNSGTIIYKRETTFRRLDYTFWSSPVAGQNLKLFSPLTVSPPIGSSRFYDINEATNSFVAIDPVANNFTGAKGYMLRSPNDLTNTPVLWTGTFTGVPNNGNIDIAAPVTNGGTNLIGNPYPSTINADLFLAANPGTLYFYTHSNLTPEVTGGYATYTTLGPTEGVNGELFNGFIQVGQGFVYQPSATTTAHFTNSMRTTNNDNQFFRSSVTKHRLWLNLEGQSGFLNQILIGYMDGATEGNDTSLDGKSRAADTFISSIISNERYAVQARPLPFNQQDIVALSFKAENAGAYTLSLDHFDGLFSEDQDIFLKDNLTGSVQDLKQNAYSFWSESGDFQGRFSIVYQSALGLEVPVPNQNNIVVYTENGMLKINSGTAQMSAVKVFDIRGRLLLESTGINASTTTLKGLNAAKQLLVVQITADTVTITKKAVY